MVEQFANNATTTLNGGITSIATTLVVNSAAAFPTAGNFRILIDTEVLLVTGVAGTTFTVSRGQEGTTAITHLSGATVSQILTNGSLQQFRADTIQSGTFANRPAAGIAGRYYRSTNGNILFIDNGATWVPFGPSMPLIAPPAAASFSITQTGSNGSLTDDAGGLFFTATQRVSTEDVILATQANPGGQGAAYTLTVGYLHQAGGQNGTPGFFNYHVAGIGIYNSTTTQIRAWEVYCDSTGAMHLQARGQTGLTGTGSALFDQGAYPLFNGPMIWLQIQDDGTTNRTCSISTDGRHFKPIFREARATGMTTQPDKIGLYLNAFNADAQMTCLSFNLTSP